MPRLAPESCRPAARYRCLRRVRLRDEMLNLANTYSDLTPQRGRDLLTLSLGEVAALTPLLIIFRYTHALPDARLHIYEAALALAVIGTMLVAWMIHRNRLILAALLYIGLLFARAVLIALPDGPAQPFTPYLIAYTPPILAADVLLNRRVTVLMTGLALAAILVTVLLNAAGLLLHGTGPTSVAFLVWFTLAALAFDGILLGTFAGDPYPNLQNGLEPDPDVPAASATPHLTARELAEALTIAMRVGRLMLTSGAVSFRSVEAMERTARALGVERLDVYLTPTGIVASAYSGPEHRTQATRIPRTGVAMNRVVDLETMTHRLREGTPASQVIAALEEIERPAPLYPPLLLMLAAGAACGALSLVFNGGWREFLAAGAGAFCAQALRLRMVRAHYNPLPMTVACAALATLVSVEIARWAGAPNAKAAVIASVLLLVPGVPLVGSIVDLTRLDLISGIARGVQSLLIFICIALGMLIVLLAVGYNLM